MSVQFPVDGEVFTLRAYKTLVNRPDIVWANTYEFRIATGASGVAGVLENAAVAVREWEQRFHLLNVRFVRSVVSTYVEDGQPYNPASFLVVDAPPLFLGLRNQGDAEPVPLQMGLSAVKAVPFGRSGRMLYRGVLHEGDVTTTAGEASLTAVGLAALNTLMALQPNNLIDILQASDVDLVMKGSSSQDVVRLVQTVQPKGVQIKKFNNRYFDRGAQ